MNAFIYFAIFAILAFVALIFVFMYRLRTYEKPLEIETPEDLAFDEALEKAFSEAKVYKYKTPFDKALIHFGVKDRWDSNREKFGGEVSDDKLFTAMNLNTFIRNSFDANKTPEGSEFWYEISKK